MGLAASQARFLGITARKSNIEYEGQQVNQQRTALAEEVNALYNKLLAMKVPIAPDTTDFYESNYTFTLSNTEGLDGDYAIKSFFMNDDGTYYLNTERTYQTNVAVGKLYQGTSIAKNDEGKYIFTDDKGTQHELKLSETENDTLKALIEKTYPDKHLASNKFYIYQDLDEKDKDKGRTYYIPKEEVEAAPSGNAFSTYYQENQTKTEPVSFPSATIKLDDKNRLSVVEKLKPVDGDEIDANCEVGTKRSHDDEGYQQALRDYTMTKEEYDKRVADLNAQTESLQQEDKVLELRLDQIDTEQNELQTELEAVKAVLDKNIENTFKTFS